MIRAITLIVLLTTAIPLGHPDDNSERYRKQCADIIAAKGQANSAERLWKLFDVNWEYRMISSPESATWRGYPGPPSRETGGDPWHNLSDPELRPVSRQNCPTR